jgi:TolB-like protein
MKNLLYRSLLFLVLILMGLLISGCANSTLTSGIPATSATHPQAPTLAVAPFENLSRNKNAGLIMTDLANTILQTRGRYIVRDISVLQDNEGSVFRRHDNDPWELQIGLNAAAALKIGRELDNPPTDYVLAGSVGEYGFVDSFGETVSVGVNLQLLRVHDGVSIWTGSLTQRRSSLPFDEESAHRLAHVVLKNLVNTMIKQLDAQLHAIPEPSA